MWQYARTLPDRPQDAPRPEQFLDQHIGQRIAGMTSSTDYQHDRDWPTVANEFRQRFPDIDPEQYREVYGRSIQEAAPGALLNQAIQRYRLPENAEGWGQYLGERLPFVGSIMSGANAIQVREAALRIRDGQGTGDDYNRVGQYMAYAQDHADRTQGWSPSAIFTQIGDIASHIPGFAAEFGLTAGAFTAGRVLGGRAVSALTGGASRAAVARTTANVAAINAGQTLGQAGMTEARYLATRAGLSELGTRAAIEAPGFAIGSTLQALAMPHRTFQSAAEMSIPGVTIDGRRLQIDDRGDVVGNLGWGFLDTLTEVASERTGAAIPFGLAATSRSATLASVGAAWTRSGVGRGMAQWNTAVQNTMRAMHINRSLYDGMVGEVFEERVGEVVRGLVGLTRQPDGSADYGAVGDIMAGRFGEAARQLLAETAAFAAWPVGAAGWNAMRQRAQNRNDAQAARFRPAMEYLDAQGIEPGNAWQHLERIRDYISEMRESGVSRDTVRERLQTWDDTPLRSLAMDFLEAVPTTEQREALERHRMAVGPFELPGRRGALPEPAAWTGSQPAFTFEPTPQPGRETMPEGMPGPPSFTRTSPAVPAAAAPTPTPQPAPVQQPPPAAPAPVAQPAPPAVEHAPVQPPPQAPVAQPDTVPPVEASPAGPPLAATDVGNQTTTPAAPGGGIAQNAPAVPDAPAKPSGPAKTEKKKTPAKKKDKLADTETARDKSPNALLKKAGSQIRLPDSVDKWVKEAEYFINPKTFKAQMKKAGVQATAATEVLKEMVARGLVKKDRTFGYVPASEDMGGIDILVDKGVANAALEDKINMAPLTDLDQRILILQARNVSLRTLEVALAADVAAANASREKGSRAIGGTYESLRKRGEAALAWLHKAFPEDWPYTPTVLNKKGGKKGTQGAVQAMIADIPRLQERQKSRDANPAGREQAVGTEGGVLDEVIEMEEAEHEVRAKAIEESDAELQRDGELAGRSREQVQRDVAEALKETLAALGLDENGEPKTGNDGAPAAGPSEAAKQRLGEVVEGMVDRDSPFDDPDLTRGRGRAFNPASVPPVQAPPAQPPAPPGNAPVAAPPPPPGPVAPPQRIQAAWEYVRAMWQTMRDEWNKLGGASFPIASRLYPKTAEKMGRLAGAGVNALYEIADAIDIVFQDNATPEYRRQVGAAYVEMNLRTTREKWKAEAERLSKEALDAYYKMMAEESRRADYSTGETEETRKQKAEEAMKRSVNLNAQRDYAIERVAKVKTLIGEYSPLKTEEEFQRVWVGMTELRKRYESVSTKIDELFREIEDIDFDEELDPGTQFSMNEIISLITYTEGQATAGTVYVSPKAGNLQNTRVMPLGAANFRKGDAYAYETDLAVILEKTLARRVELAAKAVMHRTAVQEGAAAWGNVKVLPNGDEAEFIPNVKPKKGTQDFEGRAPDGLSYSKKIADEVRQVLQIDRQIGNATVRNILGIATRASLASTVEIAYHSKNLLTFMFKPGVSWNPITYIGHIQNRMAKNPEFMQQLIYLSKIGAQKAPGMESGLILPKEWSSFDPTHWGAKVLHLLNDVMRVEAHQAFERLKKRPEGWGRVKDNINNERDFTNQLGNYLKGSQSKIVVWLRDLGVGPFATAGTNYFVQGVRALTMDPGVTADTYRDAAVLRGEMLAKSMAVVGSVMLVNYLLWGQPDGDDETPFGAIKIGEKDGKTEYINLTALVGITRGARQLGLVSLADGLRRGSDTSRIIDNAYESILSSLMHPAIGPPIAFAHTALTGRDSMGHSVVERHLPEGTSRAWAQLRAAIRQANPVYASLSGASKPDEVVPLNERLWGLAGPYGVRFRGSEYIGRVREEMDRLDRRQHDALTRNVPMSVADQDRLSLLHHVGRMTTAIRDAYPESSRHESVRFASGLARAVLGERQSANQPNPLRPENWGMLSTAPGPVREPGGQPGPSALDVVRDNLVTQGVRLGTHRPTYARGETAAQFNERLANWNEARRRARQVVDLSGIEMNQLRQLVIQRSVELHRSGQRVGATPTRGEFQRASRIN